MAPWTFHWHHMECSKLLATEAEEPNDLSKFKFQKQVPTKKRHGCDCQVVFKLANILDLEEEHQEDEQTNQEVEMLDSCADPTNNHSETDLEMDQSQDAGGNKQGLEQNDDTNSTTTTTPNKNNLQTTPPVIDKPDVEDDGVLDLIKQITKINDQLSRSDETTNVGGSGVTEIVGHQWWYGQLCLKIQWSGSDTTWENLKDMCQDHPRITAHYVLEHQLQKGSRKWKKPKSKMQMKYGIKVPCNIKEAIQFNEENGNTFWQDTMKFEVDALMEMDCFPFKTEGYHPGTGPQRTTLYIVFDVKQTCRGKQDFKGRVRIQEAQRKTRFNNNVWICLNKSGKMYKYICTHVDNFMICYKEPDKDSSEGPPDYYLGNDYKKDSCRRWCVGRK
eukprot:2446180-Ditylum_brightwellii.AAC.1